MSLDWDITKVKDRHALHNWKTGTDGKIEHDKPEGTPEYGAGIWEYNVTQACVWRLMAVGMGSITEANVEEIALRSRIVDEVLGTSLYRFDENDDRVDVAITLMDFRRRIGLRTNVGTESKAKFKSRMWAAIEREANYKLSNDKREEKKAREDMPSLASPGTGSVRVE